MPSLCCLFTETSVFWGLLLRLQGLLTASMHIIPFSPDQWKFYDVIICSGSRLCPVCNPSSFFFRLQTLFFFSSLFLLMLVLSCSNLLMDKGFGTGWGSTCTFSVQQAIINVNDQVYGSFLHDTSISGAFVGILLAFTTMQILIQGNHSLAGVKSCFIHQVFYAGSLTSCYA